MPEKTPETWLCPICSLLIFKYGQTCPEFKAGHCENEHLAHLTGRFYVQEREAKKESKSIGIGAISDEEK